MMCIKCITREWTKAEYEVFEMILSELEKNLDTEENYGKILRKIARRYGCNEVCLAAAFHMGISITLQRLEDKAREEWRNVYA